MKKSLQAYKYIMRQKDAVLSAKHSVCPQHPTK